MLTPLSLRAEEFAPYVTIIALGYGYLDNLHSLEMYPVKKERSSVIQQEYIYKRSTEYCIKPGKPHEYHPSKKKNALIKLNNVNTASYALAPRLLGFVGVCGEELKSGVKEVVKPNCTRLQPLSWSNPLVGNTGRSVKYLTCVSIADVGGWLHMCCTVSAEPLLYG